jgi:hypothetical protein
MSTSAAVTIRTRSPLVVRSTLSPTAAVDQMADDFRQLVASKGGVESEDLAVLGWTQAQINTHGHQARTLALADSVRDVAADRPRRRKAA